MLPEHVPSGAARQGRDYRSTASAAKQIRFPPRRRRVRGQSNGVRKRGDASLKQQTLTQMDFISSFGEEVTLTDDDGAACDWDKLAIPRRKSKAETAEKPQESTGEDTPVVIQDSFGSSDDGDDDDLHGDASAGVWPPPFRPQFRPPFQPRHVREAVTSPYSPARMEPLDAVKASPRRRAHLSGNLEGSGRLEQRARADGSISLPAHVPSSSGEEADDREIPDSDEENEELQLQDDRLIHQDASVAGDETQLALEELASLECPKLGHAHTLTEKLPASARPSPVLASSGRVADYEPALPTEAPTFESQRVPLHVLQSFTPASARTDILLPTSSEVLNFVIDGTETFLRLAYRVPEQVRRFWLFGHDTLRYMACVQPGKPHNPGWSYHIDRVYELNNPVIERDMQEDGWTSGQIRRYIYLPPAIVGRLLWNLRRATCDGGVLREEEGDGKDGNNMGALNRRSSSRNYSRGADISSQPREQAGSCIADQGTDRGTDQPSSLLSRDNGSNAATLPTDAALNSSPLLTKSQMLSDSLISDALL